MEKERETPGVYHSIETVLSILKKHSTLVEVKSLLSVYEDFKLKEADVPKDTKKKLFVVLEGLDGCGKSTMTKCLAKKLEGELRSTPPCCILNLRQSFDSHPQELRRAYYALGNYIAASEVSLLTVSRPVIMDRFWHSTAAYAIANGVIQDAYPLPAAGDSIYLWPSDLLKPDIVFFIDVDENIRLERLKSRKQFTKEEDDLKKDLSFRQKLAFAYKTMREPDVTIINGNLPRNKVLPQLLKAIECLEM